MKILQVHNHYLQPGGEDTVVGLEAEQLRELGHEVVIERSTNPSATLPTLADLARAPWNMAQARRLARLVRSVRPEVVHVHNTWFHLSPAIFGAMRAEGAAIVATLHNYRGVCASYSLFRDGEPCTKCLVDQSARSAVVHACYRDSRAQTLAPAATITVARKRRVWHHDVDAIICLTDFAREQFITAGYPSDRLVVKPNFAADPGSRSQAPSASNRVIFVGRLTEEKGVGLLLEAWAQAQPEGLELHVIGDGPLRADVDAAAAASADGASPAPVVARGWLEPDEVRHEMLTGRALAFPSRWFEGFPLTMVESMAAGLPVAASELGAMPTILGGERHDRPLGFDPTVAGLAAALEQLRDDSLVDQAGAACLDRYRRNFTSTATGRRLVEVYQQAAEQRRLQPLP